MLGGSAWPVAAQPAERALGATTVRTQSADIERTISRLQRTEWRNEEQRSSSLNWKPIGF